MTARLAFNQQNPIFLRVRLELRVILLFKAESPTAEAASGELSGQGETIGTRRLGAIMFTDIVGYSAASSKDEAKALRMLRDHRKMLEGVFPKFGGTVVKTMGDGYLVEFPSAVEAVNCAVEAQKELTEANTGRDEGDKVSIRIGIHVGDVVHSGGDILGDAVNVAARIQPLADPGGICLTRQVMDQIRGKVSFRIVRLGVRELKNISYPVEVFKVIVSGSMSAQGEHSLDPKRIAVLPFTNMSPDPNDRYFADGMTEELISTVSKISELQVISRTSVMRYRDMEAQVSQIGQELSVGSILEGSVRKAGNKVRITAQLIRVEGDNHVWSQSYDRDLTDVFAIQGDIAEQVAGALKVQLLTREKQSVRKEATANPEAYTLYLKGRFYWSERTEENTRKALKYFEEAAKVDPDFANAYSGIADAYNILSDYGWMAPQEALPMAKAMATKALEKDDTLAEAHASMGLVLSNADWNLADAEKELKKAIELKPNYAQAYHWLAIDLFYMRRHEESAALVQHSLELDPYSRLYNMVRTNQLLIQKKYDEALRRYDEMIAANPDFTALRYWRSICYLLSGRNKEAVDEARAYVEMEGKSWTSSYSMLHLGWVLAAAGNRKEAEEIAERGMREGSNQPVSPTGIAMVLMSLGRNEEGYDWLAKAFTERDPALPYFNGFPWFKDKRMDPRWEAIEAKFPFRSAQE
jgi:TolB-like protein/Flp pilus assembly protein TadD